MKATQNIKRNLLALFWVAFGFYGLKAAAPDNFFAQGNMAYKNGNFAEAISQYLKARRQGVESEALYYNLGNAYYKNNAIAEAILNYERAAKLAPDDEDVQHNLKLANLKTTDRLQQVPQLAIVKSWDNFLHSKCSRSWALISAGLLWMALLFFAIYLFMPSIKRVGFVFGILLLLTAVTTTVFSFSQYQYEEHSGEAILMADNAYVKSAPDGGATDLFLIHEGLKMQLLDQVGEWFKIRLADGKVGWIPKDTFEKI
ncbi:MAG: tetratricopeptide repeat protein [Chitinophagales bacterium]